MSVPASNQPIWAARRLRDSRKNEPLANPAAVDQSWMALGQSWRAGTPEPNFQSGWARVRWHETGLHYETVFIGTDARNSARQLNQRTWELGDVGEIFLETQRGASYLELHITPENARLQLLWSADGLARVRNKDASLAEFMIDHPGWVQSQTQVQSGFWSFQAYIPASRLGLPCLQAGQLLHTAVCRYHCRGDHSVLSSTASLPLAFFHHREGWHALLLADEE